MDKERIALLLAGPHQAVLSVSRVDRGPVAVPISYHFSDGDFFMVTPPDTLHGRLMARAGRATMTVQFEACDGRSVHQWYVMAEGPVRFTDLDPSPHVRTILAKDRGETNVEEWTAGQPDPDMIIRTGGEFRPSNFLLWQCAYTELYFMDRLW